MVCVRPALGNLFAASVLLAVSAAGPRARLQAAQPVVPRHGLASGAPVLLAMAAVPEAGQPSGDLAANAPAAASGRPAASVGASETDARIARADEHVNAGKQLCFQGDTLGARREFDAAIDALLNAPDGLVDRDRLERHLDEVAELIYRFDRESLGAGAVDEATVFDKAPIDEISHATFAPDPSLVPKVRTELTQTVSEIPLELSDPVLGYIHYFSTERGRNTLLAGLRRAGRYKSLIRRVLAEEGVPEDLLFLAQAESGFLPRAVSNKRASGMWQFIAGTGSLYDLNRTKTIDERFDPEKATRAAARHLRDLYARYHDWYLAMAAYNCGAGNVDRAVERTGYADYWKLLELHALPRETANYVPIIVAMTIMAKNPGDYGLLNVDEEAPLTYDTVQMEAPTSLALIADAMEQPLSMLRDLNPAYLTSIVPAGMAVHVPAGSGAAVLATLAGVPRESRCAWRIHHVTEGETLAAIARQYHLPTDRLAAVNAAPGSLASGASLLIPAVYRPEPSAARRSVVRAKNRVGGRYTTVRKTLRRATHVATVPRGASTAMLRHRVAGRASITN